MFKLETRLALPDWIGDEVDPNQVCSDDESKMALAIHLADRNVELGTGGPFGAAIFDADNRLVSVGVNRVVPETSSVAHAEMMAYLLAQARTKRARINELQAGVVLATSAQPCCMCYGATFWAGIDTLLIGASAADVMELTGFDEGPLPADWRGELESRGIIVREGISQAAARDILARYAGSGGINY